MRSPWLLLCAAAMSIVGTTIAVAHYSRQRDSADAQVRALTHATVDAQRVLQLRGQTERASSAPRPTSDVLAHLNQTLSDCGVPAACLKDLAQESDVAIEAGPPQLRRQIVVFTLEPIDVHDLGRLLTRWSDEQPLWTPVRLDLTHVGRDDSSAYACRVSIAATYVAEGKP